MAAAVPISDHEAALYDRQIRLWGLDAQQRLRSAKVLVIGIRGLSAEIVKNIVLAGAGNVTLVDETKVTAADLGANFFLAKDDIGKPVSDRDYYADGTPVAVAIDQPLYRATILDDKCRHSGVPFVMADSFGFYSVAFIDADKHCYYEMRQETAPEPSPKVPGSRKRTEPDKEPEKKEVRVDSTVAAPSLAAALALPWSDPQLHLIAPQFFGLQLWDTASRTGAADIHAEMKKLAFEKLTTSKAKLRHFDEAFLERFARNVHSEISAVCAIVGGIIGQEIIKIVTAKDEPLHNFFFYDGWQDNGLTAAIPTSTKTAAVSAPVAVVVELLDD